MDKQLDLFPEWKELEELRDRVEYLEKELAMAQQRLAMPREFYPNTLPLPKVEPDRFQPLQPLDIPRPYYYTPPPETDPLGPPFRITCVSSKKL